MRRGLFVLLAVSLGLNAGLLYVHLWGRTDDSPERTQPPATSEGRRQWGPRRHPEGTPGFIHDRLGRIGNRLGLSEEQREGMARVLDEMMPQILAQRDEVQESQETMRLECLRPQADRQEVLRLQRRISVAQARLDSLVAETMFREAALLSPEQRAKYFEIMPWKQEKERGARMRKRRGRSDH